MKGLSRRIDGLLLKLTGRLIPKLSTLLTAGLWFKSPRSMALTLARSFFITWLSLSTLSLWLYSFSSNPIVLLLPLLSPLTLALGLYLPYHSARSRKAQVEAELPIFSVLASVMAVSGLSLIRSFDVALENGLFPAMSKEASLLRRDAMYFNRSPLEALEGLARNHPSESFKQWIFGYTSILRSGGDVATYLASKARGFLKALERKWISYAGTASVLSEAVLALFLICPLSIALTSLVFASELGLMFNNIYSFLIVPLVATFSATFIHSVQPRTFNSYELNRHLAVAIITAAFSFVVLRQLTSLELHEVLLTSLASSSLPLAIGSYRQIKAADQAERALPDFLREVTEQVKLGLDVSESVKRAIQRSYGKSLDEVLLRIRNCVSMGLSLEEAVRRLKHPSWIVRSSLFILAKVSEGGFARPLALEMLTDHVHDYCSAKFNSKSNVRLQLYVGYIAPALMVAGAVLIEVLARQVSSPLSLELHVEAALMLNERLVADVLSSIMSMTVLTSFIIGVMASKVYDLTFLSLRHPLICLLVAAISMRLAPLLIK
ncbi:MAG: type II secretion system F family protein [Candidatus Nezhaarchaeota archaeon]|nr:type II secretion system F family protein [Candidatus Nezhaarchaeota archaeon]